MRPTKTCSTQKILIWQQNAWFDTKMLRLTQKCPTQHVLFDNIIMKHPPLLYWNSFSNLIKTFCFKEPIHRLRWKADKLLAALYPYIRTWLTTSPANHRPANFWKCFFFFLNTERKLWKVVQSQAELMRIKCKFEAPILRFFKYK